MADNETSITLAGDWSKPATVLLEKISDAIGGAIRPHQIVRVAKAEAKAAAIHANAEIEVKNIQRRAMRRFVAEETKKQANMEQIIRDALPQLEEKATPQDVPDDWLTNFFEKGRIISDAEMQKLWAKVLAGEANNPGSFSKATVNLLSNLDKSDAEAFTRLCGFAWRFNGPPQFITPIVAGIRSAKIYLEHGIDFDALSHLQSLGLVHFDTLNGFVFEEPAQPVQASYFGAKVSFELPNPPFAVLDLGNVLFTRAGQQLASISLASPVKGFFEFLCKHWQNLPNFHNSAAPPVANS